MAKTTKGNIPEDDVSRNARLTTSPEDKAKANQWFNRAKDAAAKRQFDYAIEYYIGGLEYWPDAVEEACRSLHGCAVARRQTGGKKPGLKDTMKRSMSDKDPKQAYINALWLFGHEPDNLAYIEGVFKCATRLRAEGAAFWAAGILLRALDSAPKTSVKQFTQFAQLVDELADRASGRGDSAAALAFYQLGIDAVNSGRRKIPRDQGLEESLRDISTKLTILKGKYKDGDSYRDSVQDVEEQRELHDEQRSVQSDTRLDELIAKAQREYEENPDEATRVKNFVDLLCRREREDDELKAIGTLVNEYKRTGNYRWKHLADDVRMKQLSRKVRELLQADDKAALKEHQVAQLRFELSVFKERVERYPTDYRVKFEYAKRNFQAGRFDEAIPLFQKARLDPKNRAACGLYLGRCFFRKNLFVEATATFEETIAGYEISDDETTKELLYWLGRTQEAASRNADARATYGKLLQIEYNYKDVRTRQAALPTT